MKLLTLVKMLAATAALSLAGSSYAGVAKVLRVDNQLDADLTIFVNGNQVGVVAKGTVGNFPLSAQFDAKKDMQLLGTETDGGVYQLDVKDVHANGFTWGVFEGDGQG